MRRVVFYDGAAIIGQRTTVPYTLNYKVPSDVHLRTADADGGGGGLLRPDRRQPGDPDRRPGRLRRAAVADAAERVVHQPAVADPDGRRHIAVTVSAPAGAEQVDMFLGDRKVCTDTLRRSACTILPTGADVGIQVLRAVLTDNAGATAETTTRVLIPHFKPKGLSVAASRQGRSAASCRCPPG